MFIFKIILKSLSPVFMVSLFFSTLRSLQGNETKADSSGDIVLEYGRLLKAIPLLGLCAAIGFPVIMYMADMRTLGKLGPIIYYVLVSGIFLLMGLYLYLEFFFTKFVVSDTAILHTSFWHGNKHVAVDDIVRVDFSQVFKYYKLGTKKQEVIEVYIYMNGVPRFLDFLERKLKTRIERYY
jgi:hypothetical protein